MLETMLKGINIRSVLLRSIDLRVNEGLIDTLGFVVTGLLLPHLQNTINWCEKEGGETIKCAPVPRIVPFAQRDRSTQCMRCKFLSGKGMIQNARRGPAESGDAWQAGTSSADAQL